MDGRRVLYSEHALDRMLEWDIDEEEVHAVIVGGETIEEYADDCRLLLGRAGPRPLHVVVVDREPSITVVITVYPPDPLRWDTGFRARIRP